ncbi:MAG: hypothetical protein O4861_13765 [Trichodesmium sp. St16_bin4-tuft]|nr:hypothetical protein [Trichodesmium sp. St2_bin6]MDE5099335.1 hypothetical protein [Trichodesmium sp. St16_bin4-tuft]
MLRKIEILDKLIKIYRLVIGIEAILSDGNTIEYNVGESKE